MKTWFTLRVEDNGVIAANFCAASEVKDDAGETHVVTASVPFPMSVADEVPSKIMADLAKAEPVLATVLACHVATHMSGVNAMIEKKTKAGIVSRAVQSLKELFAKK